MSDHEDRALRAKSARDAIRQERRRAGARAHERLRRSPRFGRWARAWARLADLDPALVDLARADREFMRLREEVLYAPSVPAQVRAIRAALGRLAEVLGEDAPVSPEIRRAIARSR